MSAYHEWFASNTDKITVKKPVETVQTVQNSFPVKAPWVEPVNEFNAWNDHAKQRAKQRAKPVLTLAPVAVEPLTQANFQLDFTVADVEELPIDEEATEPGPTDAEIIALAPERMRSADPNAFLGKVIGPKQFDILAARGRVEGFGIHCEPLSEDILCNWKLIKVWDLAKGYDSTFTFANVREGVVSYVNL